jgi:glycosyltransferase involved in cell wall biosynthesis
MKILHFCESFSRVSETFIYDLIVELECQGVDNHVVALERQDAETRPFAKVTVVSRAQRFDPWRMLVRGWHGRRPGAAQEAAWGIERPRLRRVLEQMRPDLVHAHFGPNGVLIAPVARELGTRCVTSFHGYDVTSVPHNGFWQRQYQALWSQASAVTGPSGHVCGLLAALGAPKEKIVRISNGVKLAKFPFNPPGRRYDGRQVDCMFVGRLVEKKGPLQLLRAFEHARKANRGTVRLTLHIVGDGPLMPQLREESQARGLTECVEIHGARTHDEVRGMLQKAHLFLQHSVTAADGDQEGQGVTLIEASAVGLPVISTRHDGIPEVVLDQQTGYLVEEHDVAGMGEKLASLAANPGSWDEFGRRGREHVEKNLRLEAQVEKWRNLYQQVIRGELG